MVIYRGKYHRVALIKDNASQRVTAEAISTFYIDEIQKILSFHRANENSISGFIYAVNVKLALNIALSNNPVHHDIPVTPVGDLNHFMDKYVELI